MIVRCVSFGMIEKTKTPFIIGIIGALIGLKYPKVMVGVFCSFVLLKIGIFMYRSAKSQYKSARPYILQIESFFVSKWYRSRIQLIKVLRSLGLSRLADRLFDSESKR